MRIRVFRQVWLLPGCQVVFRYSSSRRIVRACVRPLDTTHLRRGPLWRSGFRSGSGQRTHVCPLLRHGSPEADHAIGCFISRPKNSPPPASGEIPSANSVAGCASGVDHQLPLVSFLLPAATSERAAPVVLSPGNGNACSPLAPFFASRDFSRNEHRHSGSPSEGGEQPLHEPHTVRPPTRLE